MIIALGFFLSSIYLSVGVILGLIYFLGEIEVDKVSVLYTISVSLLLLFLWPLLLAIFLLLLIDYYINKIKLKKRLKKYGNKN